MGWISWEKMVGVEWWLPNKSGHITETLLFYLQYNLGVSQEESAKRNPRSTATIPAHLTTTSFRQDSLYYRQVS